MLSSDALLGCFCRKNQSTAQFPSMLSTLLQGRHTSELMLKGNENIGPQRGEEILALNDMLLCLRSVLYLFILIGGRFL